MKMTKTQVWRTSLSICFFKGTEKNPAGTFDRILESKGADTNAATSKDFTHYYITIPSKSFDGMVPILTLQPARILRIIT